MNKLGPIILCAGGTGGHVAPAIAVYEKLHEQGIPCQILTDGRCDSFVSGYVSADQYALLPARPLRRTVLGVVRFLIAFVHTLWVCFWHYRACGPRAVLIFGGYSSLAAGIMAFFLKIPLYIHEQNAHLGRTNRFLSPMARRLLLTFSKTTGIPAAIQSKTCVTGIPVRAAIVALKNRPYVAPNLSDPFHFTILGGSQGAHFFTDLLPSALEYMAPNLQKRLRIHHQVPPSDLNRLQTVYGALHVNAQCAPFFSNIPELLASSHAIMARAGASTIGELIHARIPPILVPYPLAMDNHQMLNAQIIETGGGAWVFDQKNLTPTCLSDLLCRMMTDQTLLREKSAALAFFSDVNSTDCVIEEIKY